MYKYIGLAVGLVAVCAVALMATRPESPTELLTDSVTVANKILKAQRFKKADSEERAHFVKKALFDHTEHKSGQAVVSKIAEIVAQKHESYHDRMEAMKKLLDSQTDSIKDKSIKSILHQPHHADAKKSSRGRSAAKEEADNAKAVKDASQLIVASKKSSEKKLKATPHDKKVHEETSKASADVKEASSWMKKQVAKADTIHHKAAPKAAPVSAKGEAKAIKEGEKLMHHLQKKHNDLHSALTMSKHDEKIHKETKHAKVSPSEEANWLKHQVSAKKAAVKKAAMQKQATSTAPETKQQKLLEWAEAHGLPKKLAENPKDKQKVKDIIARMKADAEVERIKEQMKHDDSLVKGVVHSADPSAASSAI